MKQMSFTKLPLVMCIHLKRFEHTSNKTARKVSLQVISAINFLLAYSSTQNRTAMCTQISTFIQFPLRLDMRLFRSSNVLRERHGFRVAPDSSRSSVGDDIYELFAVVAHHGTMLF